MILCALFQVLALLAAEPAHGFSSAPVRHHPTIAAATTTTTRWKSRRPSRRAAAASEEASSTAPRHDVGDAAKVELSPAESAAMAAYGAHQQNAPKLGWPTDVRSLVEYSHGFAVLSTISKSDPDYPGGSVVAFAVDDEGRPLFSFSGMAAHTPDILANPHCSLTVAAKEFKGVADGRVNLMGRAELLQGDDAKQAARDLYMLKHPGAFWVDFGDFNWFRMSVDKVRLVGGFARVGQVSAAEYAQAKPDPVAKFGPDIAKHMNDDHMEATIAMVQANVPGLEPDPDNKITEAIITSVDSLGMYVKVTREKPVKYLPQQFKLRLPFSRPALDRKDVKVQIIELTNAAAAKAE